MKKKIFGVALCVLLLVGMLALSASATDEINYVMEKEILTADKMAIADGFPLKIELSYLLHVASVALPLAPMAPDMLKCFKRLPMLPVVNKTMPAEYDAQKVHNWVELYKAL